LIPCLIEGDWRDQKDGGGAQVGMLGSESEGFAEAMRGIIFGAKRSSNLLRDHGRFPTVIFAFKPLS
jgi:hypothetical protein